MLYNFYLSYIQMQLRVPNQYKPTFLQNLLSAFLPIPTRRVLSDKKIQKNKKINLSLTQQQKTKSTKKLTVSSSFYSKATPSTNQRKNNKIKITRDQTCSTLKQENIATIKNKGLNFHPRKINFPFQNINRPKLMSQIVYVLNPIGNREQGNSILRFQKDSERQKSTRILKNKAKRNLLVLKSQENTYYRERTNSQNGIRNDQFIKNLKSTQLKPGLSKQKEIQKIIDEIKLNKKQSESKKLNYSIKYQKRAAPLTLSHKIDRLKEKSCPIKGQTYKNSRLHIYQSEKQLQSSLKKFPLIFNLPQKSKTQQNRASRLSQTQKDEHFESGNLILGASYNKNKHKSNEQSRVIMRSIQKQREEKECLNQNLLVSVVDDKQLKKINKCIANIFQQVPTIQSKKDYSDLKSQSNICSNVIIRINGNEFKQVDNEPRQWDQIRRQSLNTRLIEKYQQSPTKTQVLELQTNFRKKSHELQNQIDNMEKYLLNIQDDSDNVVFDSDNLKYLEQLYITKGEQILQNQDLSRVCIQDKKTLKISKSIYDEFTKINYLGVGRFASVYLCYFSSINFIFAMKQILKFTVKYNQMQQHLHKQITIQFSCNHPNIISLYYAWSDDKKYYLSLQYGQETLLSRIQKDYYKYGRQQECIQCIFEIAKGLEYLHHKNIIHRDIKPQNIILVNGVCKIADFGWSTQMQQNSLSLICGTPCYISPQMENNQVYTTKSDCWSLGMLAYQLVSGKLDEKYFSGGSIDRDTLTYDKKVSQSYRQLVYQLLAKQQQNRPSIKQILTFKIFQNL